ncbi:MoaD/ThiS family protein [Thalassiella azotivora]
MQELQVRYFAGAAAAAGVPSESVQVSPGLDVAALRALLADRHPRLVPVLASASLLVDEVAVSDPAATLAGARTVDVLPPFAGG